MARVSRSRTNRTVIFIVVMAIAVGSALQFRRLKKATAEVPPLQMSVAPNSTPVNVTSVKPSPIVSQPIVSQTPAFKPLVTQTPDPTKPVSTVNVSPVTVSPVILTKPAPINVQAGPVVTKASTVTPAPGLQVSSGSPIADASAKVAAGDLIGARTILNNALVSGSLSATDTDAVKKQMSEINQTLIFSPRQFPKDPLGGVYTVKSGDKMSSIGNAHEIPYELLLPLNRMTDARKLRYGQTLKIINGPFHAIVSKSKFTLDVYLGAPGGPDSTYITTFNVGLGTDNSTPTGTWSIKNKVVHPAYFPPEGHAGPVLAPDDPKNPLGAYWMGLEGTDGQAVGQRSYGIHGTIDPTSIGKQSSMGCIRLKNEDVEVLYKLLMQGKSTVIVNP